MLICRADLEAMLKIMDKFGLMDDYAGLDLDYKEHPASYELAVSFSQLKDDIMCKITIDIDQNTREHLL